MASIGGVFNAPRAETQMPKSRKRRADTALSRKLHTKLLGALLDPGADQADFFFAQRSNLGLIVFRRHVKLFVLGHIRNHREQGTLGNVTGGNRGSLAAALQHVRLVFRFELALRLFLLGTMALEPSFLEIRLVFAVK